MRKNQAFTLIELMIVMAIIAILATAGIQAYADYIRKSRDSSRGEIARNLNSSVMAYAASNDGNPPATADDFTEFLASAGETFGGAGVTGTNTLVVDPVGGKDVCLDADGEANQPCRFDYTAYDDGTYAISYGVEHKSSKEKDFYVTTKSVLDDTDTNDTTTKEKYGVYTGSAPYIGSTPTKSNPISVDGAPIKGVDTEYTPVESATPIAMADVVLKGKRIDVPTNPIIALKADGVSCTTGSQCEGGYCVPFLPPNGSQSDIINVCQNGDANSYCGVFGHGASNQYCDSGHMCIAPMRLENGSCMRMQLL